MIESPFEFHAGQQKLTLDPAGQRQDLGPALSLWGMTAEQIRVAHNSDLEVRFERATVHVPPSNFEAWEVAIGHVKWVARPGGGKPYEW